MAAQSDQRFEQAISYWQRAVDANPYQAGYRASLAQLLAHGRVWERAREQSEAWVRLDPASIEARSLWVSCLLHTGDRPAATAEFAKIERLQPPNLPLLRARFAAELRAR
jgi:protein involved in temperature-dependent protein secretion